MSADRVLVRAARVLDETGTRVLEGAAVLVRDGIVERVDRHVGDLPAEGGPAVVDLGDVTLLPGLVDAHVHLALDAAPDVVTPVVERDDEALLEVMHAHAQRHLDAGVTTVRDLGDRRFLSLRLRDRYRATPSAGPALLVSGPPLTRTRGHCWFLGGEADTVEELRAAVAERAERGCDVVKVMVTGGVLTPGYLPHESQYDLPALRAVVDAARAHGLPVAAHAHGTQGVRDSAAAGVHSLEHCTFFTETGVAPDWDLVARIVDAGTFVSTTTAVVPDLPPPPAIAVRVEQLRRNLGRMHATGARLVITSDAGVGPPKPHGVLPHGLVQATSDGFTPAEALASATAVAADLCGLAGRKGRIAPGHDADLLAVHGDPLTDVRDVLRVAAVLRAGVRVR